MSAVGAEFRGSGLVGAGTIELHIGPMMSGKTSAVIALAMKKTIEGRDVLIIKHKIDDRYGGPKSLISHGRTIIEESPKTDANGAVTIVTTDKLITLDILKLCEQVVVIDEGQFFNDLLEFCVLMANRGLQVFVSALDGDSEAMPFGQVCDLVPKCDKVKKHLAVCGICKMPAPFTKKNAAEKGTKIQVGGRELYTPVCRVHFTV